jgi:hypothetical protein
LLAFMLFTGIVRSQAPGPQRQEIRGLIVEDTVPVPDVHVLNLSALKATISDADGFFRIDAGLGDTLLFSAVRYRRTSLVIEAAVLGAASLLIPLEPFVNELDEVVVSPYDLTGDLGKDVGRLPVAPPVTAFSLGLPNAGARRFTQTENRLNEATTGAGIVPLNPLLNAITGRTRRLKKQLALESRYEKAQQIRMQYPDSIFVSRLGIPQERIPDFMYYCEVDSLFQNVADSGDRLRIWGFLNRKSGEYRKNNALGE